MEDLSDVGSALDLLDDEIKQSDPFLYEDLWRRLKNNPYYPLVINDGLVTDFKINLEDWTEKEVSMSGKFGIVLQYTKERARGNKEISALAYDGGSERLIAHFFLDAFVHIEAGLRGWARWAMICIRGAEKYAKQCVGQGFHPDYLKGVDYLSRWTLLHIYLRKGKIPSRMEEDYDALAEYECLPDSAKAFVLAPKAFLLVSLRNKSSQAWKQGQLLMKEMVQLDSTSSIWSYTLGNWLRTCRRRVQDPSKFGPGPDEILMLTMSYEAIVEKAFSFGPEAKIHNSKDVTFSAVCQLVADIVKSWDQMKRTDFFVKIGEVTFDRNSGKMQLMEFLFDNVKKLNSKEKDARYKLSVLIRSAEILCNSLPPEYRDYDAAEDYLLQALKIMPDKSKILHKLGVVYLISRKHFDIDKALDFFRRAVELEPKNFPALLDLILTLMGQPEIHKVEVERRIGKALDDFADKQYDVQRQKAKFHFFHGCLKFMLGETMDAVRLWVIGQSVSPTENFFLMIVSFARRYHWNLQKLYFYKINTALEEYSNEISSSASFDSGFELLKEKFGTISWNSKKRTSFNRPQYQVLPGRECDEDKNWREGRPRGSSPPNSGGNPIPTSLRRRIESSSPTLKRLNNWTSKENQDPSPPTSSNNKYVPPGRRNKDGHGASLNICPVKHLYEK